MTLTATTRPLVSTFNAPRPRAGSIEVVGLTKRFGTTTAVDDLSFEVPPGRVTGFLGPNGAGKSTTMRMILGLDRPDSGTVLLAGRPYRELGRPLHQVGALLDAKAVHGARSARHHLLWLAQSNGIPSRRVDEVLDLVGLADVAKRRLGGFSLGMGQRLGIAAALLGDPDILMFDEPVNGLDPEGILWIRNLLKQFAAEGRTVFVSSHLMSEMALTADHLIVIGRGRLVADTSVADFIARSSANRARVRSPRAAQLADLLRGHQAAVVEESTDTLMVTGFDLSTIGEVASAHGITLHELSAQHASLEQAFMELTGDSVEYHGAQAPAAHGTRTSASTSPTTEGTAR